MSEFVSPFTTTVEPTVSFTRSVASVCPYCGVGCGMILEARDNQIVKVTGDKNHPANFGRLCTKGQTSAQALPHGRMASAFIRSGFVHKKELQNQLVKTSLQDAIQTTATGLLNIIEKYGPDAVSFYVSGQMSIESQYLINKLAKGFVRTNNLESNSRLCMASAGAGYKLSLGSDAPPGSYQDFDHTDLFFVIGSNMADCHPILYLRMMDRIKLGAKLIVVDPRRTITADKADLYLPIKPGTDLALLNGLLFLLHQTGKTNPEFIARYTQGWDSQSWDSQDGKTMPEFLAGYTPEKVSVITGLTADQIIKVAGMIGDAPEFMTLWTMGLNQSTQGTWNTNAICNLHLATGKICRLGSGPFSLTGQPNAMGGREMGYMGPGLPGQRSLLVQEEREHIEKIWQLEPGSINTKVGKGTVELFEKLASGEVKACWIICTNPVASIPNRQVVIDGLKKAELVVVQDTFLDTETTAYADIFLPGALWAEAEGVMVNSERNLTLMQAAVNPPGDAIADWDMIARVARAMGFTEGFNFTNASEVFEEIKTCYNPKTGYDLRGVSYEALRESSMQWPCADAAQPRNPIRYLNKNYLNEDYLNSVEKYDDTPQFLFATASGRAQFLARAHIGPAEIPCDEYPFILNTGRLQHQWHTMTKTGKIPTLNKLNPGTFVEINPQDAERLGIRAQDKVEIRNRRGQAILPALVTDRMQPGSCFAPIHWNDVFGEDLCINAVTSDKVDPISFQPELKVAAVALTRIETIVSDLSQETISTKEPENNADIETHENSLLILWSSQTGNAEALAEKLADVWISKGWSVQLAAMNTYSVTDLVKKKSVTFITSTFGDGDSPDNGSDFWAQLNESQAPSLTQLEFSLLALGDSSYAQFCGHGKKLFARLKTLGAIPVLDRIDCDVDYADIAAKWMESLTEIVSPRLMSYGIAVKERVVDSNKNQSTSNSIKNDAAHKHNFTKTNPYQSQLVINHKLTADTSAKDVRHFGFDLRDSGIEYQVGDALGVWPKNCSEYVEELTHLLKLKPDVAVQVNETETDLHQALTEKFEICRPSQEAIKLIANYSQSGFLLGLLHEDAKEELQTWLYGRQLVDLLYEFPISIDAQELLSILKPIQPRLYSIASSQKFVGQQVDLTVSAVRYARFRDKKKIRKGVCSTYLADRAEHEKIPIFIQPSKHFHVPENGDTPIIMVGPGTGIAPFRGFLQERQARGDVGKNWLFFGEQHQATDFYFQDEIMQFKRQGLLTELSLAFSRDQREKIYVQDRMRERAKDIWQWLEEGAYFYVCGDASKMAKDVDAALRGIIREQGGFDEAETVNYIRKMNMEKRYLRDVY